MAAEKLTRARFIQIVLVMIFFLGLFVWRTFDHSAGKNVTPAPVQCSLNAGECLLEENTTLSKTDKVDIAKVVLTPLPPKAEHSLQLVITGVAKDTMISARVEGRDMFMGEIPVLFSFKNGRWIGDFTVGSCTSKQMVWLVNIMQNDKLSTVSFTVTKA